MGNEKIILPADSSSEQVIGLFKHLFCELGNIKPELVELVKDQNTPIGIRNMAMKTITKDRAAFRTTVCLTVGGLLAILMIRTLNESRVG